jgi:hypothetical protein
MRNAWSRLCGNAPLEVLPSPYRSLIGPVLDYVDGLKRKPGDLVTVILPEVFTDHWWDVLLQSSAGPALKLQLLGRADIVVTNVRYRVDDAPPPGPK